MLHCHYRFARPSLVDEVIALAGSDAAQALQESTAANIERVAKYLARYQEVQAKRLDMQVGAS